MQRRSSRLDKISFDGAVVVTLDVDEVIDSDLVKRFRVADAGLASERVKIESEDPAMVS